MKSFIFILAMFSACISSLVASQKPNILMFAIDDLSDWISPMGYQQAKTPNMDRLAKMGVTFQNAHTAGSYCAPSRTAIFTGRHASTTGFYTNQVYFKNQPEITPLQVALQEAGYRTFGGGKLFHHPAGYFDLRGWNEIYTHDEKLKQEGWPVESWTRDHPALPKPYPNSIYNQTDRPTKTQWFLEWGAVLNENEELMADTMQTNWVCRLLSETQQEPFFIGLGLYAPHFPNYVPQKYFDLYDRDTLVPPPYFENDLDDLHPQLKKQKMARGKIHQHLEEIDAVKDAIHGYLSSVSYVDAMLGRILDSLEESPYRSNTVIIIWSDHGYHHGEKSDWGKHTLWERTSNVPFMWAGPGIAQGQSIEASVSLIDIYPTLMEIAGAEVDSALDGVSLLKNLQKPETADGRRAVMLPGLKPNEYAIMTQSWRYIHYANGAEELYNVEEDPNEWNNLASNPDYERVVKLLAAEAPENFAEPSPSKDLFKLTFDGESFEWVKK
jgi:arylsulfatase A-like enzyme